MTAKDYDDWSSENEDGICLNGDISESSGLSRMSSGIRVDDSQWKGSFRQDCEKQKILFDKLPFRPAAHIEVASANQHMFLLRKTYREVRRASGQCYSTTSGQ